MVASSSRGSSRGSSRDSSSVVVGGGCVAAFVALVVAAVSVFGGYIAWFRVFLTSV